MEDKNNKQSKVEKNQMSRKGLMWLTLAGFIVKKAFVDLGKAIHSAFVPEAYGRERSGFSHFMQTAFSVMTLEGPRLMLISRYRAARMKRKTKVGISLAGGTSIAGAIAISLFLGTQLLAVTIDGKVIGYVENEGQYTTLLQQAKEKISKEVGTENTEILIQDTNVSLNTVVAPQQSPLTPAEPVQSPSSSTTPGVVTEGQVPAADPTTATDPIAASPDPAKDEEALVDSLIDSLKEDSAIKATYYTITINDNVMATLGTMREASDVMNKIAESYTPQSGEYKGRFTDKVAINSITAELEDVSLQSSDEVVSYLLAGTSEERAYVAEADDDIDSVCEKLGLNKLEFLKEYPDYDFNKIKEGDEFSTTLNTPFIHYETVGVEISNDPVPYEVIEKDSSELFLGQREVKEEGVLGERMVTRHTTRINGEIISATELESEPISLPIAETVYVGTKMVAMGDGSAYVGPSDGFGGGGNGPLGRPLDSWVLTRSVGGAHQGADMVVPLGTPIYAAEYGTVSFAGVFGGYGNLLIIDHGNGLQTYYAHCDSFNTQEGAVVERGQQIAAAGNTGRSTANHLHFEVRVNTVVQEPMNWIS